MVAAQGVAGALEGGVSEDLAQHMILVGAEQPMRQPRVFAALPALPVFAQRRETQVGDETDRRQRLSRGGDLHRPFQGRPHAVRAHRQQALEV